jgi:hypothetical protein
VCNPVSARHPELLLARGTREGLWWEVTVNTMGYRCGYVRVPRGHPWHGRDYDAVRAEVHGGLTFSEPDLYRGCLCDGWWLGFDCAHYGDAPDPELRGYACRAGHYSHVTPGIVRTTAYVTAQCEHLADQALQAEPELRARALTARELAEGELLASEDFKQKVAEFMSKNDELLRRRS